nr:uncharacterized protein CTRU02_07200 [Colletotrichum truncatum]KAF6791438.1 hypothetical protein CTRU02_07200 [Colletotrichum truncatum]
MTSTSEDDLFASAIAKLHQKVPHVILQEDYDSFYAGSYSSSCKNIDQARDLLISMGKEKKYRGKFHRFFEGLNRLLEPLRILKDALDTLCQVEGTFCLVWGSMKLLIEIAKEVSQVPVLVSEGIEKLVGLFPTWETYSEILSEANNIRLRLQEPLVEIYVEYLTFCILASKLAKNKIKTTLQHITLRMLKYEAMYRESYTNHLLLVGSSKEKFFNSIQEALQAIGLPQRLDQEPRLKLFGLHDWLLNSRDWLLLIDNARSECVEGIRQLLASDTQGHVILTTQSQSVATNLFGRSNSFPLEKMEPNDAVQVFISAASLDQTDSNLELGQEIILRWDDGSDIEASKSATHRFAIAKHFKLVLSELEVSHPDALMMLRFYSLLEPELIPLLDSWQRADLTPELPPFTVSSPRKDNAGQGILQFLTCCLRRTSKPKKEGERALWMHDLTKKMTRSSIPPHDDEKWLIAGINALFHLMPVGDSTDEERAWVNLCIPQAMTLVRQAESINLELQKYGSFLALCALCNLHHGSWALSKQQYEIVRPLYERHLGLEHHRTINLLKDLAWAARLSGEMKSSETYFQKVLELREKTLGPNSPDTLETLNDLATTIERAGKLKQAELMFQKLYDRYNSSIGPEGVRTLAAAHNLATCLHNQGRLAKAEEMYKTALATSRGAEDTGTLKTLSNYAATLDHDGRFDEAKTVYDEALTKFVKAFGVNHLLTLRLRGNMACLLKQQGKFDQAEKLMGSCLETVHRIYGPDSFEAIADLYSLGEVLQVKGELCKAVEAYQETLRRSSGEMATHPVVFRFIDSLGAAEREMGHLEVANEKAKDAYSKFESLLGWDDPYTLMAANDYAEVIHADGRYKEAWDLYTRCQDSFETLLGREHPHVAMVMNNMGRLCWVLNDDDPMRLFTEAKEILATRLGANHFCTLTVNLNIARTKAMSGDFDGAVRLASETQIALKSHMGDEHPLTLASNIVLGIICASRGDTTSLTKAKYHLLAAIQTNKHDKHPLGANVFLSFGLLILVLKRLPNSSVDIINLLADSKSFKDGQLSPFHIHPRGKISFEQLCNMDTDSFDFSHYIPLSIGETTKLRWGRKTCWREMESAKLHV